MIERSAEQHLEIAEATLVVADGAAQNVNLDRHTQALAAIVIAHIAMYHAKRGEHP